MNMPSCLLTFFRAPRRVSALAVFALLLAAQANALDLNEKLDFDIPAQSLSKALLEFSRQAKIQVVVGPEVSDQSTPGVIGNHSIGEALDTLLKGAALEYSVVGDTSIAVGSPARTTSLVRDGRETQAEGNLRLAQADTSVSVGTDSKEKNTETASSDSDRSSEGSTSKLEEIVVTGTHIRGVQNNTIPMFSLDRKYIESTGIATIPRLIETLPQNFALANQSSVFNPSVVSGATTQSSSINLRGIGEGTTLVLLNGRRMALGFAGSAVDITALPLTAVERVEVLTDGASALYGSDAVGGVVNFILRKDFDGAETRIQAGHAKGLDEYRLSQALGNSWGSGNALVSLEYYKRGLLDASDRDFVPADIGVGSLLPRDKNYSALISARQEISDTIALSADGLYAKRDSFNEAGAVQDHATFTTDNPQMTVNAALDWQLGAGWNAEFSGGYARNELESIQRADSLLTNGSGGESTATSEFEIETARIKADGQLFTLGGGDVRAAVGADWRSESVDFFSFTRSGQVFADEQLDQIVRSLFAEVYAPIVGSDNARPGLRQLELSIAGRYDEYSSFGSSFDPQFGVMWGPVSGLKLRTSYGTSYVAPKLASYSFGQNSAAAFYFPDAATHILQIQGNAPETYVPQNSKNWTFGFEWAPEASDWRVSMNYYRIKYTDRLSDLLPFFFEMLNNDQGFGGLAIRDPSQEQVESFIAIGKLGGVSFLAFDPNFNQIDEDDFDPSSVDVILDQRTRNLSVVKTSGLDLSLQHAFEVGVSRLQWGLMGSYILELENQVTDSSTPFDPVDTYRNPPALRVSGSFGWQRGGWQANLFAHFTDSYDDNRFIPSHEIRSNLTLDTRLAYQWGRESAGFLSGVTLAASAQNLFDRDPPPVVGLNSLIDLGFDPENASALGRLLSIEVVKSW